MINNQIKTSAQKIFFLLKSKFFMLIILSFGCVFYLMDLQIQALSLEIKNLLPTIELLEESHNELKNQLFLKDQQIKMLENTIENLKINLNSLSLEMYDFETLRDEVIKSNSTETAKFYLKLAGIITSFVLVLVLANNFKETLFTEVIELKFVDSVNNLMWSVRIPENKEIDLIIKKIDAANHDQVVEFVQTTILKTAETLLRGSPDGIELISSSVPVSERVIAASQITEILSSTGIF